MEKKDKLCALSQNALDYHRYPVSGKLGAMATKRLDTQEDLALAYSPGVAAASQAIVANPDEVSYLTSRSHLVAVATNGTAVLGLGNIGPLAAKPVMEGKAVLFKKFSFLDAFDLEINETDPKKFVDIVASLEPTFGGINLEDIKAPECFYIEQELQKRLKIPVFHDDQHGTAVIVAAAILNGLKIVNKDIKDVVCVVSGAGAAAIACLDLLVSLGMRTENILLLDTRGVVHQDRSDNLPPHKAPYARKTKMRTLSEACVGADIFLGLSTAGALKHDMVTSMAAKPLILALSNPTPEIFPEEVMAVRNDAIIATGRSDYPNQVNNVLCFPYIFRGALDVGATCVNEKMKKACVFALADLAMAENGTLNPQSLIPGPFDPRLITELPLAVAKAAIETGVATRPIENLETYRHQLLSLSHSS